VVSWILLVAKESLDVYEIYFRDVHNTLAPKAHS